MARNVAALRYSHDAFSPRCLDLFLQVIRVNFAANRVNLAGLVGDLASRSKSDHENLTLLFLQQVQNLYCAIWTEAIWQIADASGSATKLIISDHPVTVYNRACPPLSKWCLGHSDPDIRMNATHTYFPLSLNKMLILTNLSWVRDPYQNEQRIRPNPTLFRSAMFNFLHIQVDRMLTEDEVLQINYITKRRAYRHIAAAERDWLFPEKRVSTDHWKKLGDGYLLMPEPRLIHMGGEIFIGYDSGAKDAFGAYEHKPWLKGYKDEKREKRVGAMVFAACRARKHSITFSLHRPPVAKQPPTSRFERLIA